MSPRTPSYRRHKASGQAVVTIGRKDYYLGPYGTKESVERYQEILKKYREGTLHRTEPTVADLASEYERHAYNYYRKPTHDNQSKPTHHYFMSVRICHDLVRELGGMECGEIQARHAIAIRKGWIARGLKRQTINTYMDTLARIVRYGVEVGLVPGETWHAIKAIRPLSKGRSEAEEYREIGPAPARDIAAALLRLKPTLLRYAVQLQIFSGMRPGEVCCLKREWIKRECVPWVYEVPSWANKTAHRGRARIVNLGPKCRKIVDRLEAIRGDRWFFPDHKNDRRPMLEKWYGKRIEVACRKAGCGHWSPNQLRHLHATMVRKRFGINAARVILGHAETTTAEIYATQDQEWIRKLVEEIG